jgi:hypothetical protein
LSRNVVAIRAWKEAHRKCCRKCLVALRACA